MALIPHNYISLVKATKYCYYSQEYLSLRARQRKLKAIKIGRNWVTKKEWVEEYLKKVEEYKNNLKTKKFVQPPENLPVEPLGQYGFRLREFFKIRQPRFALIVGLVFVLLTAGVIFGKESFVNVYRDLDFHVAKFSQATDLALKEVFDSTKNIISLGAEGAGIIFSEGIEKVKSFSAKTDSFVLELNENVNDFFVNLNQSLSRIKFVLVRSLVNSVSRISSVLYGVYEDASFYTYIIGNSLENFFVNFAQSSINFYEDASSFVQRLNEGFERGVVKGSQNFTKIFKNIKNAISTAVENISQGVQEIAAIASPEVLKETFAIFKEYGNWFKEKLVQGYHLLTQPFVKGYQFLTQPWRALPEVIVPEKVIEKEIVKEKEVERVTKIEPVKEITKEIIKIEDKALSDFRIRFTLFESETKQELAKRIKGVNLPPTLSPGGGTSVSTLGTITTGTWNASTITVPYGGTGLTSVPAGYTLIGDSSNALQATSTLFISSAGNVGIGTTSPEVNLHVYGGHWSILDVEGSTEAWIRVKSGANNSSGYQFYSGGVFQGSISHNPSDSTFRIYYGGAYRMVIDNSGNVGIGTTTPASWARMTLCYTSACTLPSAASTTLVLGSIDNATNTASIRARGTITGELADIGEYVKIEGNVKDYEPGDLLEVSPETGLYRKSSKAYSPTLAGPVTEASAFIGGGENVTWQDGKPIDGVILSLAGQVSVKVSTENGPIQIGDPLTSASSTPGVAMKATKAGRVVGMALEPYDGNEIGKIMIFVNPHWIGNDLAVSQDSSGQIVNLDPEQLRSGLASLGLIVNEYGVLEVRELKTKKVVAEEFEMKDKATGEIYCTWIENGEWVKVKRECESAGSEQIPSGFDGENPAEGASIEEPPVEQTAEAQPPAEEPQSQTSPGLDGVEQITPQTQESASEQQPSAEQPQIEQQPVEQATTP